MPYLITTLHPWADEKETARRARTRRAVATLDEARDAAIAALHGTLGDGRDELLREQRERHAINDLPESGGTIGPLPDGTVITVERVDQFELAGLAHWPMDYEGRRTAALKTNLPAIINAYNAAQD